MKSHGLIDRRILSFDLQRENRQSEIIFGEPTLPPTSSTNVTMPLIFQGALYSVELNGSKIGTKVLSSSVKEVAFIDTGTSLLVVPPQTYAQLIKFYKDQGVDLEACGEMLCCSCYERDRSSLVVTLGGQDL